MKYSEDDIYLLKRLINDFNNLYQEDMNCISEELADVLASLECYDEEILTMNGLDIIKYRNTRSLPVKDLEDIKKMEK